MISDIDMGTNSDNIHEMNEYRQQLRCRIIELARRRFSKDGIRATKMDSIASDLSVSKRTVYELFATKEDLLLEVMKLNRSEHHRYMDEVVRRAANPMEIILEFFRQMVIHFQNVSPVFLEEVRGFSKAVEYRRSQDARVAEDTRRFLSQGVEEGYFRSDVNYEILSGISNYHRDQIFTTRILERFQLVEVFRNTFLITLRGISTEKGLRTIDEYERRRLI